MDQFLAVCPEGKQVSGLDDIKRFNVKELKQILKFFKKTLTGKKHELIMKVYAIFSQFQPKIQADIPNISSLFHDHSTCTTFQDVFIRELRNVAWSNDLRNLPNFTFASLNYINIL